MCGVLNWWRGPGEAIQAGLSVLLISCPCALGLATPLAVWTALSLAASRQVLFRSGEAIERLARVSTICFDKTGTLTTGEPRVLRMIDLNSGIGRVSVDLRQAVALAESSRHPFSLAIARYGGESRWTGPPESCERSLRGIQSRPGAGVRAESVEGRELRLGSYEFAGYGVASESVRQRVLQGLSEADQLAAPIVVYSVDGVPRLLFLLGESLRAEAAVALLDCQQLGLKCVILTGDRAGRVEGFRQELGRELEIAAAERGIRGPLVIPEIRSGLLPGDKASAVLAASDGGGVAMVGDGINDAPALAVSEAGIAMGCGADVSRDSAHVCLLSSDLTRAPWAVLLARRTTAVIRRNLFWAFGYNTVGVLLAAAGLLNPAIAAALMIVSSLLVIGGSLSVRRLDGMANPVIPVERQVVVDGFRESALCSSVGAILPAKSAGSGGTC